MNIIKKLLAVGALVAVMGVIVLPRLSAAQDYAVSPSYVGTSSMSVATANQICMSLPDTIASQTSFCTWSAAAAPNIADNAIRITVTTPTTAVITWTTSIPTTSTLWYASDPSIPTITTQYMNAGDGYTMSHTITITGINLTPRHLFMVGGTVQTTGLQVSSGEQAL